MSLKRRYIRAKQQAEAKLPISFITSDGVELQLQRPPAILLMEYMDESDKPKPPMRQIPAAGGVIVLEANPDDPDYKRDVDDWSTKHNLELLRLCCVYGVENNPPETSVEVDQLRWLARGVQWGQVELKYRWVASLLKSEEEIGQFIEAVMGTATITEEGLAEASQDNRFRDSGERAASDPLALSGEPDDRRGEIHAGHSNGRSEIPGSDSGGVFLPAGNAPDSPVVGSTN